MDSGVTDTTDNKPLVYNRFGGAMNKEPENLSESELLRIENLNLRRQILQQQDEILISDIARTRCLDKADYGKTWVVQDGRILTVSSPVVEEVAEGVNAQP